MNKKPMALNDEQMRDWLFEHHAMDFNFELSKGQLFSLAATRGYVIEYEDESGFTLFTINEEYGL